MARLSNEEIHNKSINELKEYAGDHPKEAVRIATHLGKASTEIVYNATKQTANGVLTATFSFQPKPVRG